MLRRWVSDKRWTAIVAACSVVGVAVLAQIPATSAQFTAQTGSPASAFGASASFCAAGSVTLPVLADTWANFSSPDENYGDDDHLEVRADPDDTERIYLRPDLPVLPTGCDLTSAVLALDEHGYIAATLEVQVVTGAWAESTLTWNNQPGGTGPTSSAPSVRTTWSVDVTAQIQAIVASGTNNGIRIVDVAEGTPAKRENRYHSLESGNGPPPLITYSWA